MCKTWIENNFRIDYSFKLNIKRHEFFFFFFFHDLDGMKETEEMKEKNKRKEIYAK